MSTTAPPQQPEEDNWLVRFLMSSPGIQSSVEPTEETLVSLTHTDLPRVEPAEETLLPQAADKLTTLARDHGLLHQVLEQYLHVKNRQG